MQLGRLIISLVLLLTYSLGYTHNLVPHCQQLNSSNISTHQEKGKHHHHEHHQHTSNEDINSAHEHIVHEDHYDEGIYDLVVCFFNAIEHPSDDCNTGHYILPKTNNRRFKKITETTFLVVFFSVLDLTKQKEIQPSFSRELIVIYRSPLLSNSSNRGPPSISC